MESAAITLEPLKTLIPLFTFILGVGTTWWFKSREKKEDIIRTAAKDIGKLVTDWYHQLDDIKIAVEQQLPNEIVNQKIGVYAQNRFILPKLQQNLEIISGHSKCESLKQDVEEFLSVVTKTENYSITDSVSLYRESTVCAYCNDSLSKRNSNFQIDYSPLLDLRRKVDALVQVINKEVGRVIKTL